MKNNKTVKELPEMERPYEKCLAYGPKSLSDAELLAVILKNGTREKSAVELARDIIAMNPRYESLAGIYQISREELLDLKGVGKVKAIQIQCVGEIARRIARAEAKERIDFHSPEKIADYFMEQVRYLNKEEVHLLLLDGKHSLIREVKLSVGTVNAALSSPREVFVEALKAQAVYVILIHNHPSGDPSPSNQDILLTKRVQKAGQLMGIPLSDHIIIGNQSYYSFREHGYAPEDGDSLAMG